MYTNLAEIIRELDYMHKYIHSSTVENVQNELILVRNTFLYNIIVFEV